ncbi:MAG: O-antigen/teichoic acid export membrane protein [Cyclobacteriaceae bacterium]|jgi:O-antigen/teichoic acid export membrane protein
MRMLLLHSSILRLIKQGHIKVLVGNLLASAFGLLNFAILARLSSKTDFGIIVLFFSAAGLLDLIRIGLIRQGLVRHYITLKSRERQALLGTGWLLNLTIASGLIAVSLFLNAILPYFSIEIEALEVILQHYPLLLASSLIPQFLTWAAQARKDYWAMNSFRLFVNVLFLFFLLTQDNLVVKESILLYILSHSIVSVVVLTIKKCRTDLARISRAHLSSLVRFGKHNMSTLTAGNLLKNTDTFLIAFLMNPEAAAIFAIPAKLTEIVEIPLRGYVMTSFPKLTAYYQSKQLQQYKKHFYKSVGSLTSISLIIGIGGFYFSEQVMQLLGGGQYKESFLIVQVISISILLIPFDKYLGMSFDSINLPRINAQKVWIMVAVNVAGDLLMIAIGGPLWTIALITSLNILTGLLYGIAKHPVLRPKSFNQYSTVHLLKYLTKNRNYFAENRN